MNAIRNQSGKKQAGDAGMVAVQALAFLAADEDPSGDFLRSPALSRLKSAPLRGNPAFSPPCWSMSRAMRRCCLLSRPMPGWRRKASRQRKPRSPGHRPAGNEGTTMAQALCRACLSMKTPAGAPRCADCGSPRLVSHPERDTLAIAHIDCDAFYAAIEKRDDPSLAAKPVIIGGGRRGVVATACYVARMSGVRSAMPMFKALAACPEAVVIRPNMEKYVAVGRQVRALMLELTPLVEPISIRRSFSRSLRHGAAASCKPGDEPRTAGAAH